MRKAKTAPQLTESKQFKNEQQLPRVVRTELEPSEQRIFDSGVDQREQFDFCAAIQLRGLPARGEVRQARIWRGLAAPGDRVLQTCIQRRELEPNEPPFRAQKLLRRA